MNAPLSENSIRQATWLELFFDLVFVAVIGSIAHDLAHLHDGHLDYKTLIKFPLVFLPIWWIWSSFSIYANRYDTDSRSQRFITLVVMGLIIVLSSSIKKIMTSGFVLFVLSYFATRVILAALYYFAISTERVYTKKMSFTIALSGLISLASLLFPAPFNFIVFYLGVVGDIVFHIMRSRQHKEEKIHRKHLAERVGLLTIILLGESVISIVAVLDGMNWNPMNTFAAATGFLILGAIWWIYYDSFDKFDDAVRLTNENFLIYPNFFFCTGLICLATMIRHAITNEMSSFDFRVLAVSGMTLFYVGKQVPYMYAFPSMKKGIILNSITCITITVASSFLPRIEYSLAGIAVAMFFYVFSNLMWVIPKDWDEYLAKEGSFYR